MQFLLSQWLDQSFTPTKCLWINAQIWLPGFCTQGKNSIREFPLVLCVISNTEEPRSTLERRALEPLLLISFGDLIRSIMDLSNTTGKQRQSMTYWKNCIIHLCAADNGIMQEQRDKGRESKSMLENAEFYEECNEMDVEEAVSIVCQRT